MMKKIIFRIIFMSFICSIAGPVRVITAAERTKSLQSETFFKRFKQEISRYGTMPVRDLKVLWNYGVKKYKKEKISQKESERASKAVKRLGIGLVVVTALVGAILGGVWYKKKYDKRMANLSDDEGLPPLHDAITENDRVAAAKLIVAGADVNGGENAGLSLLALALFYGEEQIAKMLIERKANLNFESTGKYKWLNAPLFIAVRQSFSDIVAQMLEKGANPNGDDPWRIPLMKAIELKDEKSIDQLIKAKANVNVVDGNYNTPLNAAIEQGNVKLVEQLIEAGAQVSGFSPLKAALNQRSQEIVSLLIKSGAAGDRALWSAIEHTNDDEVALLIGAGVDVKSILFVMNTTPLVMAIEKKSKNIVAQLINAKANIDYKALSTALNNDEEIFDQLLATGISVDLTNEFDYSLLMIAARDGNVEAVEKLLKKGASVNFLNKDGVTPLWMAIRGYIFVGSERKRDYYKVIELLINAGAEPQIAFKLVRPSENDTAEQKEKKKGLRALLRAPFVRAMSGLREVEDGNVNYIFPPEIRKKISDFYQGYED